MLQQIYKNETTIHITVFYIQNRVPNPSLKTKVSKIRSGYHEGLKLLVYSSTVLYLGLGSLFGHCALAGELAGVFGEVSLHQFGGVDKLGVLLQEVVDESLGFTFKSLATGQDPGLFCKEKLIMRLHSLGQGS